MWLKLKSIVYLTLDVYLKKLNEYVKKFEFSVTVKNTPIINKT